MKRRRHDHVTYMRAKKLPGWSSFQKKEIYWELNIDLGTALISLGGTFLKKILLMRRDAEQTKENTPVEPGHLGDLLPAFRLSFVDENECNIIGLQDRLGIYKDRRKGGTSDQLRAQLHVGR